MNLSTDDAALGNAPRIRSGVHLISCAVGALMALASACALAADEGGGVASKDVRVRAVAHFGFDAASLSMSDQGELLAEVGRMRDVSWQEVVVVGHTDSVGADDYNGPLSRRRAEAVKRYLVGKGIGADMVRTEGKGSAAPVATNATAAGRSRNRRAEVEFRGVRAVASR